jgi:hypothetical protein
LQPIAPHQLTAPYYNKPDGPICCQGRPGRMESRVRLTGSRPNLKGGVIPSGPPTPSPPSRIHQPEARPVGPGTRAVSGRARSESTLRGTAARRGRESHHLRCAGVPPPPRAGHGGGGSAPTGAPPLLAPAPLARPAPGPRGAWSEPVRALRARRQFSREVHGCVRVAPSPKRDRAVLRLSPAAVVATMRGPLMYIPPDPGRRGGFAGTAPPRHVRRGGRCGGVAGGGVESRRTSSRLRLRGRRTRVSGAGRRQKFRRSPAAAGRRAARVRLRR